MIERKASQGIYYYNNEEIEKVRYNPYRKHNRIVAEEHYKEGIGTEFPLHIIAETSSFCQLDCIMCNRKVMTRPQQNMDYGVFKKIVDEAVMHRVYSISLYSLGEPMLNPNIKEMAVYAKASGVPYVDLSTNGQRNFSSLLSTQINEIIVSIDGDKETYNEIRGADYQTVIDNLTSFLVARDMLKQKHPLVRLQIIDFIPPRYDTDKIISEWLNCGLPVDVIYKKTMENMSQSIDLISEDKIKELNKDRKPCKQLFYTLTVQADGQIAYCCHSPKGLANIGHINKMTLKEAWSKVETIRQEQKQRKYNDFCANCTDWSKW